MMRITPPIVADNETPAAIRRKELINMANTQSITPLHAACLSGNVKIVDTLIKNGADILKRDIKQFLPLHYAVVKDHVVVLIYF